MDNLQEQLSKLIKEHLPEAQASAFKEFIQKAEDDKIKLKSRNEARDHDLKQITNLKKRVEELESLKITKESLESEKLNLAKERMELESQKLALENTLLKEKLVSANLVIHKNHELLSTLFQNKEATKSIISGNFGINGSYTDTQGYVQNPNVMGNLNVDKEDVTE